MRRFLISLALAAMLTACVSGGRMKTGQVEIAQGYRWGLLAPDSFGIPRSLFYRVEGEFRNQPVRFSLQIEISNSELVLVGLSPFGSRWFSIVQGQGGRKYEHLPLLKPPLPPALLLAFVQMVLLPESALGEVGGVSIKGKKPRHFEAGGQPVVVVTDRIKGGRQATEVVLPDEQTGLTFTLLHSGL